MKREELRNKLTDILSAAMSGGINFTQAERSIWDLFNPGLPPAEGAEEIDDETIAYAAEYQCGTPFSERWIGFVKGAKWHRSLHAQKIADKMVSERLKNAPKNCPKAAQCAHVEGGMKCPPNIICPI